MPRTTSTSRSSGAVVTPTDRPESGPGVRPQPVPLAAPDTTRVTLSDGPSAGSTTGASSALSARLGGSTAANNLRKKREALEAGGDLNPQLANALAVLYGHGGEAVKAEVDKLIGVMTHRICAERSDFLKTAGEQAIGRKDGQKLRELGNQFRGHPFPGTFGSFAKLYEKRLREEPSADIKAAEAQVRLTERAGTVLIERGWEVTGQLLTSFDHDTRVNALSFVDADGIEIQTPASIIATARLEELTGMIETALGEGDGAFAERLASFVLSVMPNDRDAYERAKSMEGKPDMQAALLPAGQSLDEHLAAIESRFADAFPGGPKLSKLATQAADIRALRQSAQPLKSMQKVGLLEASAASDLRSAIYNLTKNPDLQNGPDSSPIRVAVESAITRIIDQELPKIGDAAEKAASKITSEGLLKVDSETVSTAMERFKDLRWLADELGGRRDDVDSSLTALNNRLTASVQLLAADLSARDPATDDATILKGLNHAEAIDTWVPGATTALEQAQVGAAKFFVEQQRSFKDHPQLRDFGRLITHLARIDAPLADQLRALREL